LEKKNLIILGSAHNQKEIQEKIQQKCKAIFLSPIFYVKKSKSFLDIYKFNFLSYLNKINMLALGGINEHNTKKLKLLHIKGWGGVGLFKKKPAF
jgi:thiamine monophosphate synthase